MDIADPRHTLQAALRVQAAIDPDGARLREEVEMIVADLDFAMSECNGREPDFVEDFIPRVFAAARELKKLRERYGDEAVPGAVAAYERFDRWISEPETEV